MDKRLMADCWQAVKFRLDGAASQIDKMCSLLPDARSKRRSNTALVSVNAALKTIKMIYTPPVPKMKKP